MPTDNSEIVLGTRMYLLETEQKYSGFIQSKKEEKRIEKKGGKTIALNTLLTNLRAYIVELILKLNKFDVRHQNNWYPYTWNQYVKTTMTKKSHK